ncbi:MAG: radical SAM protein [Vicinamibacterales bacterium]
MAVWNPPDVQWVVKVSKLCNLRCTYCYEFPFLADPARMSLGQLQRMFEHIRDHYAGTSRRMDFVWHGGEPLLLKPSFFRQVADLQQDTLGPAGIRFGNSVQTNLSVMTDDLIECLGSFFTNVGVSIDLFGEQRVNAAGQCAEESVLANMQTLKDANVRFGCITVLSRVTAPHVNDIYQFFEDIDTSFRLLPIYRTGYQGQQDRLSLADVEIVAAFKQAIDRWFASDSGIHVRPIEGYIANVLRWLDAGRGTRRHYDKREAEVVYVVDTDGSLYSNADAYDPQFRHGNIFEESLEDMTESENYRRAVAAAQGRMATTCHDCRLHGSCSGYFMGEATPEERSHDAEGRLVCGVAKPAQDYVAEILVNLGLVDRTGGTSLRSRLVERIDSAGTDLFPG